MFKQLNIELMGPEEKVIKGFAFDDRRYPMLHKSEYPHIYLDHEITDDELGYALDVITTHLMQRVSHKIVVDLDERERGLRPPVEMTLKEIEEKLGYKVKIVSKEKMR